MTQTRRSVVLSKVAAAGALIALCAASLGVCGRRDSVLDHPYPEPAGVPVGMLPTSGLQLTGSAPVAANRATCTDAAAEVLGWLSPERSPWIARSYAIRGSDLLELWVDASDFGATVLLWGDPRGGTPLSLRQAQGLGVGDEPVVVVGASSDGIDLRHPWFPHDRIRVPYCVPVPKSVRQDVVAFFRGESGELIGAAPVTGTASQAALDAARTSRAL